MEITCTNCGVKVDKPTKEVNRRKRLGKQMFCSLKCSGTYQMPKGEVPAALEGHLYDGVTKKGLLKTKDEFSPFREFIRRSCRRGLEMTITVEYLKELWDAQEGKCALSGVALDINDTSKPTSASLDRIDSSIGYVVGNVRWTSVIANYAKNKWTDEDVIAFCKAVVQHVEVSSLKE